MIKILWFGFCIDFKNKTTGGDAHIMRLVCPAGQAYPKQTKYKTIEDLF